MTFQQSYDKIVAVICGVDTGLLNGKRERAMKEETFKNKILWYNFIMCLLVVCIHAQNMHIFLELLWSSIFVTLMANKIGGLQFGIYRNCQISSRVFHTAVAALPLTKANRSDFE